MQLDTHEYEDTIEDTDLLNIPKMILFPNYIFVFFFHINSNPTGTHLRSRLL